MLLTWLLPLAAVAPIYIIGMLAIYTSGLLSHILWTMFYSLVSFITLSLLGHWIDHLVTAPPQYVSSPNAGTSDKAWLDRIYSGAPTGQIVAINHDQLDSDSDLVSTDADVYLASEGHPDQFQVSRNAE